MPRINQLNYACSGIFKYEMCFEIFVNPKKDCYCSSKDDFCKVVQTSVTDQSPSHKITHTDEQILSREITPVLKEISILHGC